MFFYWEDFCLVMSVYVVGGQGVRLFVVVVSCGVLDVFLLGGFLSRHVCDLC